MNYGYDSTTPGWKPRYKRRLAADLAELCALPAYIDEFGRRPYVEIDGLYKGVRIRRLTHLTARQEDELIRKADDIFERVMNK